MPERIYVFVETDGGRPRKVVAQCLHVAHQLSRCGLAGGTSGTGEPAEVIGVVIGSQCDPVVAAATEMGFSRLAVVEARALESYRNLPYARALSSVVEQLGPGIHVMGHTGVGRDLAPRVATRLDLPLVTDVTGLALGADGAIFERPIYAGKASQRLRFSRRPFAVTVRANAFPAAVAAPPHAPLLRGGAEAAVTGETPVPPPQVVRIEVTIDEADERVELEELRPRGSQTAELTEAEIVVSGGIGVGGPEGFEVLKSLTETLGAALGASRAACNAGWIGHQHQVGQTGKTVSPKLYLALGISGQIQHQAGIRTAKCIVAVNKDANAPIFKIADYGLVADLFQVVPVLNEKLKKVLEE